MSTVSLGYTIFYVHDVGATLTFFEEAFGLQRKLHTPENDYGELETGATTLAFVSLELARANLGQAGGFVAPHEDQPCPASVTLVTDDVEGTVARAIKAGGRPYVDAAEKPWGQTVAYLLGPSSVLLEIATSVSAQ